MVAALAKLKWLVMVENQETETAAFWKAPPQLQGPPASQIQTEVYLLPAANFAEKDGSFCNSARWIQWKWKAVDPPGDAKSDQEIIARMFLAVRDLYKKEGGALPEQVLNVSWSYTSNANPDLSEVLKEINGKALTDLTEPPKDPKSKEPPKVLKTAGQQLDGFGQLKDDGSTMCGNWLHSGVFTEAGNNSARRNNADPLGLGMFHQWAFSWPANRRVMYNRASADAQGKPWDSEAGRHPVERREVGGGRPGHQARLTTGTVRRLHHAPRGRGTPLRPGPQRRSLPGALRAGGGPGGERPPSEGEQQPGGEAVYERQGRLGEEL